MHGMGVLQTGRRGVGSEGAWQPFSKGPARLIWSSAAPVQPAIPGQFDPLLCLTKAGVLGIATAIAWEFLKAGEQESLPGSVW